MTVGVDNSSIQAELWSKLAGFILGSATANELTMADLDDRTINTVFYSGA